MRIKECLDHGRPCFCGNPVCENNGTSLEQHSVFDEPLPWYATPRLAGLFAEIWTFGSYKRTFRRTIKISLREVSLYPKTKKFDTNGINLLASLKKVFFVWKKIYRKNVYLLSIVKVSDKCTQKLADGFGSNLRRLLVLE